MDNEGVNLLEMQEKMDQAVQFLHDSIRGIRGGSVTASFIDSFKVNCYGNDMLIKHVAVTSSLKGQISVKPFDTSLVGSIQKTLKEAGLNAYVYSKEIVAVSVPPPSGEDKEKIKSRIKTLGEEAKVSVRNIRKNYRSKIDKNLSEDEQEFIDSEIQIITDKSVLEISEIIACKLAEIQ